MIDAHCHLWTMSRGDYGWLDSSNADLAPIARDFGISDLRSEITETGIQQAILVQAAPTLDETRFLLSLAENASEIAGVVGWVNLADPASVTHMEEFAKSPCFKGVRPMLQDLSNSEWIATQPLETSVNRLISLGLRFDALVLPHHLPHLLTFAKQHPDLPIVIDHCAKPVLSADWNAPVQKTWRRDLTVLSQETSAVCKLSGLLTELGSKGLSNAATALKPVVDFLLDCFGPNRLMWGSDWPVVKLADSYRNWMQLTEVLLGDLSTSARTAIFGGTAQKFYGVAL